VIRIAGREPGIQAPARDAEEEEPIYLTAKFLDRAEFVSVEDKFRATARVREDGREYTRLDLSGMAAGGETGEPRIPYHGRLVRVPDGAAVRLVISEVAWCGIDGTHLVDPVQPPELSGPGRARPVFAVNAEAYARDEWMPAEPVALGDRMRIRGRDYVYVLYNPLSYNPARGTLRAASRVVWHLEFDLPEGDQARKRPDPVGDAAFADIFSQALDATLPMEEIASPMSTEEAPLSEMGADYLIITPDDFFTRVAPLAQLKVEMGLSARIVALSAIGTNSPSGPTAGDITAFIKNAYETWDPRPAYLLLVGDSENLPPHDERSHPDRPDMPATDLYYATVDGDDLFPDLFYGRLPAGTLAECTVMVNKIVAHQRMPDPDPVYRTSALVTGKFEDLYNTDGVIWGEDGIENPRFMESAEALKNYLELNDWTVHDAYYVDSNFLPRRYSDVSYFHTPMDTFYGVQEYIPRQDALVRCLQRWNEGVSLVSYHDHGWYGGWTTVTTSHIPAMSNGTRLPVVLSLTCSSGMFDYAWGDCFAEALLKKQGGGGVAVLASTRDSWMKSDFWIRAGFQESCWPGFLATLSTLPKYRNDLAYGGNAVGHSPRMGQAMNFAKMLLFDKIANGSLDRIRYPLEITMLFGDPHMHFQPWQEDRLVATYPESVSVSHVAFAIAVMDLSGTPVSGALVRVSSETGDVWEYVTGTNGLVHVALGPLPHEFLSIAVSKAGRLPHTGTIALATEPLTVHHPASASAVAAGFAVRVYRDGNVPLAGATVVASSEAGDYREVVTNSAGEALFALIPLSLDQMDITVTMQGYTRYLGAISLIPGTFTASHAIEVDEGGGPFTVTVLRDGAHPMEASVSLFKEGVIDQTLTTDPSGVASFAVMPMGEHTLSIEVTARGYTPVERSVRTTPGQFLWGPLPATIDRNFAQPVEVSLVSSLDGVTVIDGYAGSAALSAAHGTIPPPSVIVLDLWMASSASILRLQNVQAAGSMDLNGWKLVRNGSSMDIQAVHPDIAVLSGTLTALTEVLTLNASQWGALAGSDPQEPGWLMILDDAGQLEDFVAWGWSAEALDTLAPLVQGQIIPVGSAWTGDGVQMEVDHMTISRVLMDHAQDTNSAADFYTHDWMFGSGLFTTPFIDYGATIALQPENIGPFVNGLWAGTVTPLVVAEGISLVVEDGPRLGISRIFDVVPTEHTQYGFAPIPSPRVWSSPFALTIEAQDRNSILFEEYDGEVDLYAFADAVAVPVMITECGINASPVNYVEIQNVSGVPQNTTGWKLLAGDDPDDINLFNTVVRNLPTSLAAGEVVAWTDDPKSQPWYWGAALHWDNGVPGWVMLLDDGNRIVDFVAWIWDDESIAGMAPQFGGAPRPVGLHWIGPGAATRQPGSRTTMGSLQRWGSVDSNSARDFRWWRFYSRSETNEGLTVPLTESRRPVRITPSASEPFANGTWTGTVAVLEDVDHIYLEAVDAAGLFGRSARFDIDFYGTLGLSVPTPVTEGAGSVLATVTTPRSSGAVVHLTSADPGRLQVPASVNIAPGAYSATFNVMVLDNAVLEFTKRVDVFASATGHSTARARVTVLDDEPTAISVVVPDRVEEGDGLLVDAGQVFLDASVGVDTVFTLESSHPSRLSVPESVVVPAGRSRFRFDLTVHDNEIADGSQTLLITATPDGYLSGSGEVLLLDDDAFGFVFSSLPASVLAAEPFEVSVVAVDAQGKRLPAYSGRVDLSAHIKAGTIPLAPDGSGSFVEGRWTGPVAVMQPARSVHLVASDATGSGDSGTFDATHGPLQYFSWEIEGLEHAHAGAWLTARIQARDANGFAVTSYDGSVSLHASRHHPDHPVRVLTFTGHASLDGSHGVVRDAIGRHFPHVTESLTAETDPVLLADLLAGSDVFMIIPQTAAAAGRMAELGGAWRMVLQSFAETGGVIIVCGGDAEEYQLLREAELARLLLENLSGSMADPGATLAGPPSHPLSAGIPAPFYVREGFGFSAPDCQGIFRSLANNIPAVMHRALGDGHVVMIGSAFAEPNPGFDRILANAVRMGLNRVPQSVPVAMGPLPEVSAGIWSGVVQIGEEALDATLRVEAAEGVEGQSDPFDLLPVQVKGFRLLPGAGAIIEWNSAGVTPYILLQSDAGPNGPYTHAVEGIMATPPLNTYEFKVDPGSRRFYKLGVPTPP